MKLKLVLKIENLFKAKDFEDKKTGEVTNGKWKIQTFDHVETAQGKQMKLIDISIPQELYEVFKTKVGQEVEMLVGTYISNNKVGFYAL